MPLYVDREHLEHAREALSDAESILAEFAQSYPMRVAPTLKRVRSALDSTSHATDYMTQPVADYVPTATTITEAAAQAGPTPKEN